MYISTSFKNIVGNLSLLLLGVGIFYAVPYTVQAQSIFFCSCASPAWECTSAGRCTTWVNCNPGQCFCYNQLVCSDGSRTCGTCPPATEPPPSCIPGATTCSACSAACGGGTQTCSNNCGSWSQSCNTQSCCNQTNPTAASNYSPANGTQTQSNSVQLSWSTAGSWGNGCPNVNRSNVRLQPDCSGAWSQVASVTTTTHTLNNLSWGRTYCWSITRTNGSRNTAGPVASFTTPPAPVLTGQFDATSISQCPAPYSGSVNQPSGLLNPPAQNNPITYITRLSFEAPVREMRIAIVPTSVTNAANPNFNSLDGQIRNHAGFRLVLPEVGEPYFQVATVASSANPYTGAATSGSLPNAVGRATLLGINDPAGTSYTFIDANTIEVRWQIRFEDLYVNGPVNVYTAGVVQMPDGTLVSSNPNIVTTGGGSTRYTRTDTWGVDTVRPTVANPTISGLSPDTIRVNWGAVSDSLSGLNQVRSYCFVEGDSPTIITKLLPGAVQDIAVPNSELHYDAAANCIYAGVAPVNYDYRLTGLLDANYIFRLVAVDNACNVGVGNSNLASSAPWLLTRNAPISAEGGYNGFTPRLGSLVGRVPGGEATDAFLSEYGVYAGNTNVPSSRISKALTFAINYIDRAIRTPAIANTNSWYDFTLSLVRSRATVQDVVVPNPVQGNINTALSAPAGVGLVYRRVAGDLFLGNTNTTTRNKVTCNVNAVVFVEGNLTIRPHFVRNNNTGCLFIVRGDIIVENGFNSTPASTPVTGNANYDEIHALMLTEGTFRTSQDPAAGVVRDGLYIRGGVTAAQVQLGRTLGLTHNTSQPAEVFEYDPFYAATFAEILSVTKYSLREL